MLDTQSNSNARERRVSLSRTGSENGDAEEASDIFRAELVRDDHHQTGQPSRQRRGSVHVPGMVMEEGGNDNDSDAAARLKAAHRSGTNLSVPGASDSHTSALQTGARRRSFQTSSSRKSVSHADGGGAKATPTPPASPTPAAHPHDVRRPNSVSGSHTAGSATVVSTSLSRAKRIHASRLEDQILGHNSSHVTDTDYVRRIDATGHVSFIKAEEATFLERLRHNVRTASLGMGGRLIFVLTFCFLVSVVMAAYNFSLMSDDYFKSLSSYYARQHAQVTRDCALSIFAELAQVSPALATLSVTSAVLSAQSSAHACDSGLMRNVALKMPSALSSRYDSGPDLTALNAALDDYAISYNLYSTTLNQTGTSNSPMDENSINYFAVVIDNLMVNLARPLTERMQLSHTRFAAQRLTDVLQFAGVPARFLAPAVLWASFVNGPYINTTAGNPTASQSSSQLTSIGFPTTTAYIDALRRMNGIIAPVVNTFTYSSSPKTSNPLDDLYTFMQLDITNITVANFAPASSTPASRANQVYGYVTQAAPVTETFDVEPTSDIAWVVLVLPLIVLIVICFVVYTVGRRYQQRANRTLQLEIAQRSALQRAISAFVPRDFLGLMGYESIRNIRVGDHREVELTMIFFGVHNYTMLSSDASASKMFLLQQNLMTTAVSVSTRNGGFLDKFLGDGAFILFADALAAVIASVELVQESQDLAVRKRKGANNNKRSHTGHSDSMSSPSVSRENSTVSRGSESRSASKPKKPKANAKLYAQALQEVPFVEEDEEDDPKAKSQGSPQLQRSRRRSEGPMSDNDSIEMDDSPRREGDELADMESSGRTTDSSDLVKFNRREARNRISNAALPTTVIPDNDRCRVGVGIHTGLVCVGILGDSKRHSCTLISSKVNLASRLCKLTQKLRVNILLSRDVYDACGEEIEEEVGHYLRPLGTVKVYGQKKECDILEVFATDPAEVREYKISTAALWRKGQDHRTNLQFDESQEVFRTIRSECLAIVPSTVKGVDGLPFVDIPLDLHVKSRQRHHVFTEK